jgi:hypothetical protein
MTDAERIQFGIAAADAEQRLISDGTARTMAAQLQSGVHSAYAWLASTGAIDRPCLEYELAQDYHDERLDDEAKSWLIYLMAYAIENGNRGPQDGWSKLCAEAPPEAA